MLVNTGLILCKCRLEIIQNCMSFLPTYTRIFIEKVINKVKKLYSFWKYGNTVLPFLYFGFYSNPQTSFYAWVLSFFHSFFFMCNFFSFHSTIWDLSYTFVFLFNKMFGSLFSLYFLLFLISSAGYILLFKSIYPKETFFIKFKINIFFQIYEKKRCRHTSLYQ